MLAAHLQGDLVAENVGGHACRLSGKPDVIPIGADGLPLDAGTVWTMEYRVPDHVVLSPGQRATAPVAWGGWDGPAASGRVIVTWPGGRKEIQVLGPKAAYSVSNRRHALIDVLVPPRTRSLSRNGSTPSGRSSSSSAMRAARCWLRRRPWTGARALRPGRRPNAPKRWMSQGQPHGVVVVVGWSECGYRLSRLR